jgi:hypothetical protein
MKRPLVGWIAFCILAFPSVCLLGYLALSSVVPELASSPTSISPPSVSLVPHTTNTPASRTTITRTFTPPKEGLARMAAQLNLNVQVKAYDEQGTERGRSRQSERRRYFAAHG